MLTEPTPSPMDLRWRMFGFPIRVHPTFWLFTVLFGWMWFQLFGFAYLAVWVACTFVSILLHELGHAFAARACGEPSHIVLFMFGGMAIGNFHHVSRWQRLAITLAGPAMNFLIVGIVFGIQYWLRMQIRAQNDGPFRTFRWDLERFMASGGDRRFVTLPGSVLGFLFMMNLFWGIFNLLPIFPLDGGQASREICSMVSRRRGLKISLGLSFVCAGLLAIYSALVMARPELPYFSLGPMRLDPLFNIIIFALLAVSNFQMLQQVDREQRRWQNDQDPW